MKRIISLVVAAITVGVVSAAYVLTNCPVPTLMEPNYSKTISFHVTFTPVLTACVRTEKQVYSNITVVSWSMSNVIEEVDGEIITNRVPFSFNTVQPQLIYTYGEDDTHISNEETKALSALTMQQLGLSETNTVEQMIDALIRVGMAAKSISVGGGNLLD